MNVGADVDATLIAILSGTKAVRAAARPEVERLLDLVDWSSLCRRLQERRLLPVLGERLLALPGCGAPDSFVDATHRAISDCHEQDTWLELISLHLIDLLREAGIPSLALKGPILGRNLYGDLGRRPSSDIDLLVGPEDLPEAVRIAGRLGYLPPQNQENKESLPLLHFRLAHGTRGLPPLELHWRVHWYESEFSRRLLAHGVEAATHDKPALLVHELASLLLFYARDGFLDLRLACDLAAWWDIYGSQLEPGAVAAIVEEHPGLERALLAAIRVADRVVGLPAADLIGELPTVERRVRLAERLANPHGRGSHQQLVADMWLVDWLLTPPGGRRDCIWRQLHIPGDTGSSLASPSRHPIAALGRAGRLLPRYGLSLARLAQDDASPLAEDSRRSRRAVGRPSARPAAHS
jgi:hypothetical protein